MKYILIIALLVLTITARQVHKNEDDALTKCMVKHCRKQTIACAKAKGCSDNLQTCANELDQDQDLEKFDTCLSKVPQSSSLMECILNNCAEVERKSFAIESLLKRMN
ncbi:unnamed protein product [Paramecium primaurelia]|uniref:Uncharacterized protein n=1 Tax=Paramecium primaurelia TaxID=5886 RepID=A0A8S1NVN2_PARPR|nr:unnamed protein product [Paramecium primaurelia]